jgi:hypothetical protein
MLTLEEIYKKHSGADKFNDKNSVHSYLPTYEKLFAPFRNCPFSILEIGLFDGHSLRMWEEYFHSATVHGIDLCDQPLGMKDLRPMVAEGTHNIHFLNAASKAEVEKHFPSDKFAIIIDDASHQIDDQVSIYNNFIDKVLPVSFKHVDSGFVDRIGGLYVVEDISDIDVFKRRFDGEGFKVIDLRQVKGRFDDVLAVRRFS